MYIIGAGMAGLLAGNIFRRHKPIIIERQQELPNNHAALLRFRSESVSEVTGIPFKKVTVHKAINYDGKIYDRPNIKLANMYARKVSGSYHSRSIWNLDSVERYIAPQMLVRDMADGLTIHYDVEATTASLVGYDGPIISTMPMFALMKLLDYPKMPDFDFFPIWTVSFDIDDVGCDLYQTIYYPNPKLDMYRLSITGNRVIAEFISPPKSEYAHNGKTSDLLDFIDHFLRRDFGLDMNMITGWKEKHQPYGKLLPRNEHVCRHFIQWATNNFGIYSLGRWALHRQILLDEVADDAMKIQNLIKSGNYSTN